MSVNLQIFNVEDFISVVDEMVSKHNIDYIDAIVTYCERNNLEIEVIAAHIKSNARVRSNLQSEYEKLNYLPKTARLPI